MENSYVVSYTKIGKAEVVEAASILEAMDKINQIIKDVPWIEDIKISDGTKAITICADKYYAYYIKETGEQVFENIEIAKFIGDTMSEAGRKLGTVKLFKGSVDVTGNFNTYYYKFVKSFAKMKI